ncbi:MAG: hypothetical protein JWR42_2333 [Marmoricola sp.]|nr:hypothetical protein [Marmoricola sp.]
MTPAPRRASVDSRRPRVDVRTGRLTVVDRDEELPDLLAELLTRTYVSSWPHALSIGDGWAWGLDERIEADDAGLRLLRGDGTVVRLDRPSPVGAGGPVSRDPEGGYVITDPVSGLERHYLGAVPGGVPLAALRDRDGRRASVVRSVGGRPLQVRDTAGHRVHLDDDSGRVRRVHHLPPGGPARGTDLVHDDRGRLVEVRGPGGGTHFDVDPEGRLTRWTDGEDTDLRFELDAAGAVALVTDGRSEVRMTRAGGSATESVRGRAVVSAYDDAGRRTSRTTPAGSVATWTHDQDGRPVSVRAGGLEVTVARDADGRVVRRHLGDVGVLDLAWDRTASSEQRLVGQRLRRVPPKRPAPGLSLADRLGGGAPTDVPGPPDEAPRHLLDESYPVGPIAAPSEVDRLAPTDPLGRPVLPGVVWDGDLLTETTTGDLTTTWTFLDDVPVVCETRDTASGRAHAAYAVTGPAAEVVALVSPEGEVEPPPEDVGTTSSPTEAPA